MSATNVPWLEVAGITGLGDDVELVQTLGELAGNWARLAGDLPNFASALALVRAIADGATDPSITSAFQKIGAVETLTKLQAGAARFKTLLDRMPETAQRLLEPLGTFDETATGRKDTGLISWPVLKGSTTAPAGAGADQASAYSLSLTADAALVIEAGDTWPYSDPMPQALLRMRAEGSLKPKASAVLPFSAGQVGVSGQASATCALEYYFSVADPETSYGTAVAERITKLVDPFDFHAVWDAFAASDLTGIHYEFDGSAKVDVSVSLADTSTLGAGVNLDLGAKVGVSFSLGGKHFLTFRAGPRTANGEPQIIAALSRQRSSGSNLSVGLGVTLDLTSLEARVHAILRSALDRSDSILQQITPYLTPGTWLQHQAGDVIAVEAEKLVANDALRDALVRDLRGVIGIDTPTEPQLVRWLSSELERALNSAQGWADKQGAAAGALVDSLGQSLPALAQWDQQIRDTLEKSARKLVDTACKALRDRVDALVAQDAAAIASWLQRSGLAANAAVGSTDDALAGVRKAVDRYQALFRKIITETADAARAKVSAAVQIEESRLTSATLEIEGTFLAPSDAAKAVFHALTRGNFVALLDLIENGGSGADFALDRAKSSLKRYAERSSRTSVDLLVFGFGVSGSDLLSAHADVMVDGNGQVQVDATASLSRRFRGLDAEREITLVSSYSLVLARLYPNAAASVDRALGLAMSVSHIDANLQRRELERFVGSLVRAGLLPRAAMDLADSTFTRWIGNPGSNGKLNAALSLKVALNRVELSTLLGLASDTTNPVLPDSRKREIIMTAFEEVRCMTAANQQAIDATMAFLLERKFRGKSREDLIMDRTHVRRALEAEASSGPGVRRIAEADVPFATAVDRSFGLSDMIVGLRQVYFSTPQVRPDNDPRTWTEVDYRDAERSATRSVSGWLQLNNELFWSNSAVHPSVIAFIGSIATLSDLDPALALSLTLTRKGKSPETVVLCEGGKSGVTSG